MDRALKALLTLVAALGAGVSGWAMIALHPAVPVALMAAAAVGLFLVSSPLAMLVGFMGVLFVRPAEFVPALEPLMLGKLTMLGAVAYFGITKLIRREMSLTSSGLNPFMLWLAVAAAISGVLGTNPAMSTARFTEVFVKILALYLLIVNLANTPKRAVTFQVCLMALVVFIAGYTIYMKYTSDALVEGSRAAGIGMLGDPNDTALTILMATPFAVAAALDARGLARAGFMAAAFILLAGIISTQSRGGILGLGAGLFFVLRGRIRSRAVRFVLVGTTLLGLLVAAGIGKRQGLDNGGKLDESAEGRLIAWKAGMGMFRAHPLLGVGYETFGDNFPMYAEALPFDKHSMTAHNSFVLCIAETGLFGTIPFLVLFAGAGLIGLRLAKSAEHTPPSVERAMLQSYVGCLAAVTVSAFFLSQTWMWFIHILFAQAAGLGRAYEIPFSATGWLRAWLTRRPLALAP